MVIICEMHNNVNQYTICRNTIIASYVGKEKLTLNLLQCSKHAYVMGHIKHSTVYPSVQINKNKTKTVCTVETFALPATNPGLWKRNTVTGFSLLEQRNRIVGRCLFKSPIAPDRLFGLTLDRINDDCSTGKTPYPWK